ncbi:MAG: hypothetical protein WBL50_27365 [Candidatus Acidiferrum sp.]
MVERFLCGVFFSFSVVRDEWCACRDGDFLHNDGLARGRQLEAEPDTKNGKGCRDQSAVDFERVLDCQESILHPVQQKNKIPPIKP